MAINTNRTDPYNNQFNALTRKFLSEHFSNNEGGNVIISPLSIVTLLAMAAEATDGQAKQELLKVLDGKIPYEVVLKAISTLQRGFTKEGNLISSNATIVNKKFKNTINPEYREKLASEFGGELFCSNNICADVDAWVKEKTRGMIEKIAPNDADEMIVALLNAVAFEAKWADEYTECDITDEEFNNADGTRSSVKMLRSTENLYIEDASFTGFIKPYEGNRYAFMALLPRKTNNEKFFRKAIAKIDFPKLFELAHDEMVIARIPEFQGEFRTEISDLLRKMGVKTIFSEHAEFSPLSTEWLKVESIIHKAKIEVDRNGTRAAAATGMFAFGGGISISKPKIITLDRPFVYAIIHNQTKLPVFAGMANHM